MTTPTPKPRRYRHRKTGPNFGQHVYDLLKGYRSLDPAKWYSLAPLGSLSRKETWLCNQMLAVVTVAAKHGMELERLRRRRLMDRRKKLKENR